MLQKLLNKKQEAKGFTIIEVLIVLAIAGLIIVVVLIAIPQLQRNQRNESRRSVTNRIKTELDAYAGNNNGTYPVANTGSAASNFGTPNAALGFFDRYLDCNPGTPPTCGVNINDPRTGSPVGITVGTEALTTTVTGTVGAVAGSIDYITGRICDGELTTATGASARNYAVSMRLEGGAVYCVDNK